MEFEKRKIRKCLKGDRVAQRDLYDTFAPTMYVICCRYTGNEADAKDVLQESFITVFSKLKDFRGDGSLEGWIKRIVCTTAIRFVKKASSIYHPSIDQVFEQPISDENPIEKMGLEEIISLVRKLPDHYRLVFNMNVIEGYSHKEISNELGIGESTSRVQLTRAKKILAECITKQEIL